MEQRYILFSYFFRNKTLTIEKEFFNKRKIITYNADIWLKAEKFFKTVQQAKVKGNNIKIHVCGEMFLVSDLWGEYKKRYTGIHGFNLMGGVKPLSGINLDEDEWAMLTFNFTSMKEALGGKKDALKNVFTPPKDASDMIKVYKAEWYLNDKIITNSESGREFYSREKAVIDAECRKPEPGVDYPQKDVLPEMRVDCELRQPPEDTHLMNLVLIESMDRMIDAECKANCEACQVNSDSQFDHCKCGNCLDEDIDHADLYAEPARKRIKVNHLMNVFDQVRTEIGAKLILSKQLAKGALAWIPNDTLVNQIQNVEVHNSPLMNVVRNVHNSVTSQ